MHSLALSFFDRIEYITEAAGALEFLCLCFHIFDCMGLLMNSLGLVPPTMKTHYER